VNHPYIPLCCTPYIPGIYLGCTAKNRQLFVTPPVDGKSPAGELARRTPELFATSAIADGAEAHSHIAPPKYLPDLSGEAILAPLKTNTRAGYVS
jgi:hypothetical protein